MIIPKQKIKVFISSACGDDPTRQKYNLVRIALKVLIESTHFAEVYLFEDEGASTSSAGQHYTYALEDCDVCIFLIDNKDGIPDGVQTEIDTVKKHSIKALYYFCDQSTKKETPLQNSLKGAKHAKSKVVHSFEGFVENGAADLIEDLVVMYRNYCKGRISLKDEKSDTNSNDIIIDNSSIFSDSVAQKDVLTNIDQCKSYFSKLILGQSSEKETNTSEIDKLCFSFLPVLFEGVSVTENNSLDLLKAEIKQQQSPPHYLVTEKRYDAMKAYYMDDQDVCIDKLEEALQIAKKESLPTWLIKDILVDLRNQGGYLEESRHSYLLDNKYQKELDDNNSLLYYPLIDRFDTNFYEKIVKNGIKYKLQSPHTITMGHDLNTYTDALASTFVLAMYNGSQTHLQILYNRIISLSFYCAERYSDWSLKVLLLKTSIINYSTKEIDRLTSYFGDILGKLNAEDAADICLFANNRPITYQRFIAKLEAFRITGYFLDDDHFTKIWTELYNLILEWIENDNAQVVVGTHIFAALEGSCWRIEQDQLVEIICKCVEHHKRRFYDDLFKVVSNSIKLEELSPESRSRLLTIIIEIISDENERKSIDHLEATLCRLRNQNRGLTDGLDKVIRKQLPHFYHGDYRLATTENESTDMPAFISKYIESINGRNNTQGERGLFSEYADRPHEIIKNILQDSKVDFSTELIDSVFRVSYETLMEKRQPINTKMDAIVLMVFILKKYPKLQERNKEIATELLRNKEVVETGSAIMTNLNEANLRFCALLLYNCLGEDVSTQMIEILADIGDDPLSQIKASQAFLSYLEASNEAMDSRLETIVLQHSIKWCNVLNLDARWSAVRILFQLLRNPQNKNIVSNQLIKSVDSDNVYIKNSILRMLYKIKEIDMATYKYIMQKATLDTNYVVRKVADEVEKEK